MSDAGTSYYWRKLLKLDELKPDKIFLRKFKSFWQIFRSLYFFIFHILAAFVYRTKVYGRENIPRKGPYIIAANHASSGDYPFIAWALPKKARDDLYTVTTKLFYDHPFTRAFIKIASNSLRIDTVEDYFPGLRAASQVLTCGKSIYINPEGMRSVDGSVLPFRPGVGVLAVELNVPILPVYIDGTFDILPTGRIWPKLGRVSVSFGKLMTMDKYQVKKKEIQAYDIYKEVTEDLQHEVVKLREERLREKRR